MAGSALPARSQQADFHSDQFRRERQVHGELANSRGRPEGVSRERLLLAVEVDVGTNVPGSKSSHRASPESTYEDLAPEVGALFPDQWRSSAAVS